MKDLPFTSYEFLAVLMPGFIFSSFIFITSNPIPEVKDDNIIHILFIICAAYLVGHLLTHLSNLTIENLTVKILGRPAENLTNQKDCNWLKKHLFPNYCRPLSNHSKNKYLTAIQQFGGSVSEATYIEVNSLARQDDKVFEKMNSWTRLYGFSRNMVFGFLCLMLFFIYQNYSDTDLSGYKKASLCLIAAVVMYYRFLGFFKAHTLELIQWYNAKP